MLRWTRNVFEIGRLRVDVQFHTGDWYVGVFCDFVNFLGVRRWFVCVVPCFPVRITWRERNGQW